MRTNKQSVLKQQQCAPAGVSVSHVEIMLSHSELQQRIRGLNLNLNDAELREVLQNLAVRRGGDDKEMLVYRAAEWPMGEGGADKGTEEPMQRENGCAPGLSAL